MRSVMSNICLFREVYLIGHYSPCTEGYQRDYVYIIMSLVILRTYKATYYRPQRSCGKVMFSRVSVILFTGTVCIPACTGADTPHPADPPGQTYPSMHWCRPPPGRCRHPLWADTPWQTPPDSHCSRWYASYWNAFLLPPANEVHAGRYTQQAYGTHPTGMHSC